MIAPRSNAPRASTVLVHNTAPALQRSSFLSSEVQRARRGRHAFTKPLTPARLSDVLLIMMSTAGPDGGAPSS
eukprot:2639413-Rhodomonas_salina.1